MGSVGKKQQPSMAGCITGPIQIALGLTYLTVDIVRGLITFLARIDSTGKPIRLSKPVRSGQGAPYPEVQLSLRPDDRQTPPAKPRPTKHQRAVAELNTWTAEDERLSRMADPLAPPVVPQAPKQRPWWQRW